MHISEGILSGHVLVAGGVFASASMAGEVEMSCYRCGEAHAIRTKRGLLLCWACFKRLVLKWYIRMK